MPLLFTVFKSESEISQILKITWILSRYTPLSEKMTQINTLFLIFALVKVTIKYFLKKKYYVTLAEDLFRFIPKLVSYILSYNSLNF
jgi:hypothetical protein